MYLPRTTGERQEINPEKDNVQWKLGNLPKPKGVFFLFKLPVQKRSNQTFFWLSKGSPPRLSSKLLKNTCFFYFTTFGIQSGNPERPPETNISHLPRNTMQEQEWAKSNSTQQKTTKLTARRCRTRIAISFWQRDGGWRSRREERRWKCERKRLITKNALHKQPTLSFNQDRCEMKAACFPRSDCQWMDF